MFLHFGLHFEEHCYSESLGLDATNPKEKSTVRV